MKIFNLTLLLFLSSLTFGQLTWDTATSLPQNGRHGAISFEIDGKVYYGLGRNASGTILGDFWEYSPISDTWTQKANYPAGARFLARGFSVDGKGYVCMGYTSAKTTDNNLYQYNPTNDTWTQKANFPGNSRYTMSSFVIEDTAYLGTGSCENGASCFYQDFWKYVPNTDTWTQLANFPGGGSVNVCGFSIGNFGYFGNRTTTSYSPSNDFWKYNPANDSWSSIASMPDSARKLTEAFVVDGEAYVGCGTFSGSPISNYLNDFYKYNPSSNSWTQFTSDTSYHSKYDPELIAIGDSVIYSIGGKTSSSSLATVWKLNVSSFASIRYIDLTLGARIYPNPTNNKVTIEVLDHLINYSDLKVNIYNSQGVLVHSLAISESTTNLDATTLVSAGTYLVEIFNSSTKARTLGKLIVL